MIKYFVGFCICFTGYFSHKRDSVDLNNPFINDLIKPYDEEKKTLSRAEQQQIELRQKQIKIKEIQLKKQQINLIRSQLRIIIKKFIRQKFAQMIQWILKNKKKIIFLIVINLLIIVPRIISIYEEKEELLQILQSTEDPSDATN